MFKKQWKYQGLNSSSVKASDMVPELYVGLISAELFLANFLSYSGVNKWYKCLKSNENMENLNSSSVKASDMVPGVYVGPIFAELFLAIFLSNYGVN